MPVQQFRAPVEETYTVWYNPLERDQCVDVAQGDVLGTLTRYTIPAGGRERIPSKYDHCVQRVHNGAIIGGQAPQLVRETRDGELPPVLDDALNTELVKQRQAEAKKLLAEQAQREAAEQAALASVDVTNADKKMKAQQQRLPPDMKNG